MIFSIAFDFAMEIRMNDTPQGDGNYSHDYFIVNVLLIIRMNDTPQGENIVFIIKK